MTKHAEQALLSIVFILAVVVCLPVMWVRDILKKFMAETV